MTETPLRAIMVCVDYADLLHVTLPWNKHHFKEVLVVTTWQDADTEEVVRRNGCRIFRTNSFYDDGAYFNKWKALEEGLDHYGRHGWLCVMDADVLWPQDVGMRVQYEMIKWHPTSGPTVYQERGILCTPLRRMFTDLTKPIPFDPEEWKKYPIHRNVNEWAGYSQIFHATDPHLPKTPPWHETNWKHAGGADSFFQRLWPPSHKIRPSFEVLHLGPAGENWAGRTTELVGGGKPRFHQERYSKIHKIMQDRRSGKSASGGDRFGNEKIT